MRRDPFNWRDRGRSGMVVHISNGVTRLRRPSEVPLVVTMRVKDEERILPQSLESLRPLDCPVILLDDGSTDRTPEIAKSFDYVHYHRQDYDDMNELRDRRWMFNQAMSYKPEWVMTLDGDEVLPQRTAHKLPHALEFAPSEVNIVKLAIAWIWRDKWFVRFESGPFWHHRLYRGSNADLGSPFMGTRMANAPEFNNGLHCGPLPQMLSPIQPMNVSAFIKAYGYDTPEAVKRHIAFYNKYDPDFWSQRQIVNRMNEPLDPWNDDLVPVERSPQMTRELIDRKIDLSIAAWELKTNEQGESEKVPVQVHTPRRPGRPRKVKREAGSGDYAGGAGS